MSSILDLQSQYSAQDRLGWRCFVEGCFSLVIILVSGSPPWVAPSWPLRFLDFGGVTGGTALGGSLAALLLALLVLAALCVVASPSASACALCGCGHGDGGLLVGFSRATQSLVQLLRGATAGTLSCWRLARLPILVSVSHVFLADHNLMLVITMVTMVTINAIGTVDEMSS